MRLHEAIGQAPRLHAIDKFTRMWQQFSDLSEIFDCGWEDLSSWRAVGGEGDPITVHCVDIRDVEAMFERQPTGDVLEVAVMNRLIDPVLEVVISLDSRRGRTSGLSIRPAEPGSQGEYEIATGLFSPTQMVQILKIMTEIWDPTSCKWSDSHFAARQKPRLKFGPNPWKSRVEWKTSIGWCTYLDTRIIPVPSSAEWPEDVTVERFMNGKIIRIGDTPDCVTLDRLTAVRKALGWPHVVPGEEGRRL
ncbi:hypothetical protein [Nocardia salmonicida]|uniref:hypothetical protein n=1 Tax=Nocardia salmonicida TaxID=53431 RepID=UPI0033F0703B